MGPDFVPTHIAPDNRYPAGPDRYHPSRYPPPPNKYPEVERYPSHSYPDDYERDKYPPPPPIDSMENNKFNGFYGNRIPVNERYPNRDRDRYHPNNIPYDDGYYPDKPGMFPDTRNPPSRGHPIDRPPGNRYPDYQHPMMNRPNDGRYGTVHYYEPDMSYNIRYPDLPENKYIPWNQPNPSMYETRFHIGMNRIPMDIYRYGNQGRYPPGKFNLKTNRFCKSNMHKINFELSF